LLGIHDLDGAKTAIEKALTLLDDKGAAEGIRANAAEAYFLAGRFDAASELADERDHVEGG
jgi:hypothetical protein